LALPTLLQGWETWPIREDDKYSRITSAEMKLTRITAIYTLQDYKTNEDILSEIIINSVVTKTPNYRNKWIKHVRLME
jgi:hypothetical protein